MIRGDASWETVKLAIPEAVDEAVFRPLTAIDNGELRLALRQEDGSYVDLAELGGGELAGEYMGG